jgi:hypothetical protein
LGQLVLLPYAAAFGVALAAVVRFYEEPTLRRRFGEQYETYRRAVLAGGGAVGHGTPGVSTTAERLAGDGQAARASVDL